MAIKQLKKFLIECEFCKISSFACEEINIDKARDMALKIGWEVVYEIERYTDLPSYFVPGDEIDICQECFRKAPFSKIQPLTEDNLKKVSRSNFYKRWEKNRQPCVTCKHLLTQPYTTSRYIETGNYGGFNTNDDECKTFCTHGGRNKKGQTWKERELWLDAWPFENKILVCYEAIGEKTRIKETE